MSLQQHNSRLPKKLIDRLKAESKEGNRPHQAVLALALEKFFALKKAERQMAISLLPAGRQGRKS